MTMGLWRNSRGLSQLGQRCVSANLKRQSLATISSTSLVRQATTIPVDHIPVPFVETSCDRLQVDPQSKEVTSFLERLNLSFSDPEFIRQVLTHSSFRLARAPTNERLRLIGKKAIGLYLAEYYHSKYPELSSNTIDDTLKIYYDPYALALVGRVFGMDTLVRYRANQGEDDKPHGFAKVIGKSVQALVGAIYHDKGANEAKKFIHKYIISQEVEPSTLIPLLTPKRTLSALLQTMSKAPPVSKVVKDTGCFADETTFVVGVYSGTVKLSEKAGSSLKIAEFNACKHAIIRYHLKDLKTFKLNSTMQEVDDSSLTFLTDRSIDPSTQIELKP